jgi:hypothetical protein
MAQFPDFVLKQVVGGDPNAGLGTQGLANEFLIRTDEPSLWYLPVGASPTGWVRIGFDKLAGGVGHPIRALNTVFQPSLTRPVIGIYSGRIVWTKSLGTNQVGRIDLLSDAVNPPTEVQCRIGAGSTGAVTAGTALVSRHEGILMYLIPVGHYVNLATVNEVGVPTYSIGRVTEITL